MNVPDLHTLIIDLARQRYPGHGFVFFHGSQMQGSATASSDVDIVVAFTESTPPFREIFCHAGHTFDAWIYDVETLNYILQSSMRRANFVTAAMLQGSVVLPAPTSVSTYLITRAKEVMDEPVVLPGLDAIRVFATNMLDDLQGAFLQDEQCFLAVSLYQILTELVLLQNGHAGHKRKHGARALQRIDPDFLSELNVCFKDVVVSGNARPLIAYAEQVLHSIGGRLKAGYRQRLQDGPRLAIPLP